MERNILSQKKSDIINILKNFGTEIKDIFYKEYDENKKDKNNQQKFIGLFSSEFLDRIDYLKENFGRFKTQLFEELSLGGSEFIDFSEFENLHYASNFFS